MPNTPMNREARRRSRATFGKRANGTTVIGRSGRMTAVAATATATATALTLGLAPNASAAATYGPYDCSDGDGGTATCYGVPALSTGPLLGLLAPIIQAKLNPLGGSPGTTPGWNILYQPGAKRIYNAINDLPYGPVLDANGQYSAQAWGCQKQPGDANPGYCRTSWVFGIGLGALGLSRAVNALHASAEGDTVKGFKELAAVGATPDGPAIAAAPSGLTQNGIIMFNNVLRPDGGLATRFGVKTLPWTGMGAGPTSKNVTLNSQMWGMTWAYNTLADFPIDLFPLSRTPRLRR